jgi:hypothetical protein
MLYDTGTSIYAFGSALSNGIPNSASTATAGQVFTAPFSAGISAAVTGATTYLNMPTSSVYVSTPSTNVTATPTYVPYDFSPIPSLDLDVDAGDGSSELALGVMHDFGK